MHRRPLSRRRAFTLVELLIVISIIGMLMSLLLPAVNSARERARQATCSNNLRQLALAMQNHVSAKETYPGYMQWTKTGAGPQDRVRVSWAAVLLPRLERSDLWDTIRDPEFNADSVVGGTDVFLCPSDVKTDPSFGWLTYVANTGAWDNPNATLPDFKENGIFHNLLYGDAKKRVQIRDSAIKDGLSKTLLFSENIDKAEGRPDPGYLPRYGWLRGAEQHLGMVWIYDGGGSGPPSFTPEASTQEFINRNLSNAYPDPQEKQFARPAGKHPGGVNVAYCDATVNFLSEEIDYSVYQRLMTPYGKKCEDPYHPSVRFIVDVPVFANQPPLSDSDLKP